MCRRTLLVDTIIFNAIPLFSILFQIVASQTTAIRTCVSNDTAQISDCIIRHVSEKFDQLSTQMQTCQQPTGTNSQTSGGMDLRSEFDQVSSKIDQISATVNNRADDILDNMETISCSCDSNSDSNCDNQQVLQRLNELEATLNSIPCTVSNSPTEPPPCPTIDHETEDEETPPENWADIYALGHTESGVYRIYEPNDYSDVNTSPFRSSRVRQSVTVFCDMDTTQSHGVRGWTVFQRRKDGSENFYRGWADYQNGFGDPRGEFWLGNDNLALITGGPKRYELRVDLEDWSNEKRFAVYSNFHVASIDTFYRLTLGSYALGDAGDSLYHVNNRYFSTLYVDHDNNNNRVCAYETQSGFWFYNRYGHDECGYAALNNPYHPNSVSLSGKGIYWQTWHGNEYSLKFTEMKIRPAQ